MLGRKQINLNTPFLYLTKREGLNIFDLFILIEVYQNTLVSFPESNQLPQNVNHPEINIHILLSEPQLAEATSLAFKRYTFDFSEDTPESLMQKKVKVRTLIEKVGSEAFRQMELFFIDSDEGPVIEAAVEIMPDSPYLFLGVSNGAHDLLSNQNGTQLLSYSPAIIIPTFEGKLLEAEFRGSSVNGDNLESLLVFQASEEGSTELQVERINQATIYAEAGAERSFSVELYLWEANGQGIDDNVRSLKNADKKKKVKTRHGNSSKGKGGQSGRPENE